MPYETLYRRYRPKTFEEVVGQPHVVKALTNALRLKRFSHAYLFAGQRGTGKTTAARLLAKALNCVNGPTAEPCCECEACLAIQSGSSMDVIELDAASHTKVEQIRELIVSRVAFMPAQSRYRVFIIDEAHMLSTSSFNALLKTLEEPPSHVVFVLATTDPHKIPPTIQSRCQRFDFRPIPPALIVERMEWILERERQAGNVKTTVTKDALMLIARAASGSLRDALSMLEQLLLTDEERVNSEAVRALLGMVSEELLYGLMSSIADGDVSSCWRLIQAAISEGKDIFQLAKDLMAFGRELLAMHIGETRSNGSGGDERTESLKALCKRFSQEQLIRVIECLAETEREMRISDDPHLALDIGLLRTVIEARKSATKDTAADDQITAQHPVSAASTYALHVGEPIEARNDADPHGTTDEREGTPNEAPSNSDDAKLFWEAVLETLRSHKLTTFALLQGSELIRMDGDTLIIALSHPFQKEYMEDPGRRRAVEEAASKLLSRACSVRFVLSEHAERVKHLTESKLRSISGASFVEPKSKPAEPGLLQLSEPTLVVTDEEHAQPMEANSEPAGRDESNANSRSRMDEAMNIIYRLFPGSREIIK